MQYELNTNEAKVIDRMRMTADQRAIAVLTEAEEMRQATLATMTPENRAATEKLWADNIAEQSRVLNLPQIERECEMLLKRQAALLAETAKVEANLAKPEIIAVADAVQESIDARVKPVVKEV
jgi:hypothetical protein